MNSSPILFLEGISGFQLFSSQYNLLSMKRELPSGSTLEKGVELFSDMMLMKFKPKNTEGARLLVEAQNSRQRHLSQDKIGDPQSNRMSRGTARLKFMELASKDAVVIGNTNQIDMINIDGLAHNFVDTFYYWSLNISKPILSVKLSIKKEVMLVLTIKQVIFYSYSTIKKEKNQPLLITSLTLQNQVKYVQFPTSDLVALFYEDYFQIYFFNDAHVLIKKLEKKYGVGKSFKLFAVPQAIDHTVNIFFEENEGKRKTFGLWCIEVKIHTDSIKINNPYKIYDIMNSLKKHLILQNYSKDIVFLNLGQEVLIAKKGYIVDSVNINFQIQSSYLKYLPRKQILVHIEKNCMDLYSFKIDVNSVPHRIQLTSLDSIEIRNGRGNNRLLSLLPIFENNYALFYEDIDSQLTSAGEIFYSFVVSYTVKLNQKVNRILEADRNLSELKDEDLQNKCEILRKIGLADQQIYLQIWKRSTRSTLKDFQLLLATRDYKTIKNEIENKMRKQSMSFKEVYKIEESCLTILRGKIEGDECSEEILKDYLTCSLFLRKLKLFKQLHMQSSPLPPSSDTTEKIFYINIQDYFTLKNSELKDFILQKMSQFLFGKKQNIEEIRLVLNHFKFAYRYIYFDLLEQIIITSKNQIKQMLIAMPELLPTSEEMKLERGHSNVFYDGVWSPISDQDWQSNLYLETMTTINNKEKIHEFTEGLWFKRNWLTLHDFIARSREELLLFNEKLNSDEIFYVFVQKTIENISEGETLRAIFSYLQKYYAKLPAHLKNKILLYSTLYRYYRQQSAAGRCTSFSLAHFLRLKDYNLFQHFFELEKARKNALLREIKPIYEQICGQSGVKIFNESLFNYFKSETSEISNLKYLLNRINNEKKEFHAKNQQMYAVLVKAMQFKIKIGSGNDIPVDEVLIYLKNIPIGSDNKQVISELELVQRISEESELLKKMRLNMTIREIIENQETVIEKLVLYLVEKHELLAIQSPHSLLTSTYRVLAEAQSVKQKIYGVEFNQLAFFILLTKLLEEQSRIQLAQHVLNDEYLNNYYYIDSKIVESLVHYMYRWKFSINSSFPANSSYIRKLCLLLTPDNPYRQFLQYELSFALLLSTPQQPVTYPISTESSFPRIGNLQEILTFIDNRSIINIDIERVIETMKRLEEVSHCLSEINRHSVLSKASVSSEKIEDIVVYKIFIIMFIERKLFKEVIPLIKRSLETLEKQEVITILLLVFYILPELNEECKGTVKISSYLYNQPLTLLEIVSDLLVGKLTGLQSIQYLHDTYHKIKNDYYNFNPENGLFNIYFLHLSDQAEKKNRKLLVENTLIKLKKSKLQFKHEYGLDLIFAILCHEPTQLSIFLRFAKISSWRLYRSFISYLIQEEIFDELSVLELNKRVFCTLLKSFKEKLDIYRLANHLMNVSLVEQFKVPVYSELSEFEKKIEKNISAFARKKLKVIKLERSFEHKIKREFSSDKSLSIRESLKHPENYKDKSANLYAFSDSDDNNPDEDEIIYQADGQKKHMAKISFDPRQERKNFIKKDAKAQIQVRKKSTWQLNQRNDEKESKIIDNTLPAQKSLKVKKYFSLDENSPGKDHNGERTQVVLQSSQMSPIHQSSSEQIPGRSKLKSKPTFEEIVKRKQSHEGKKVDEFVEEESSQELREPELYIDNRFSERDDSVSGYEQIRSRRQEEDQTKQILKKLYRTFDDKNEEEPYSLKVLETEKYKDLKGFSELLRKIVSRVYQKPQKTMQLALNAIRHIARTFTELQANLENIEVFLKIVKLEAKYGLDLPINKMLPEKALYLKNKNADQLFSFLKEMIIDTCDEENIFKVSKVISISFKKNSIEQEVIFYYLVSSIAKMSKGEDPKATEEGLHRIQDIISKLSMKMLIDKAEGIVNECTHFDLRRKLVEVFIRTLESKGNGKDAKDLAKRLK